MEAVIVENVYKSYGRVIALRGLSFKLNQGDRCALLGPNGAGKSTTLKILAGLLKPDSGIASIMGSEPSSIQARSILGYLPEDPSPYRTLSVRENLEYIAALRRVPDTKERVDRMLDYLELKEYEKSKVSKLSRGNVQKLSLALSLLHEPKVILLDEPLNYLDIPTQEKVIFLLKRMNSTMLVSTHIMSVAERLTEQVVVIAKGNVIWKGGMDELRGISKDEPVESIVARMMTNAS
ncbi:MAG: ABC transporter ATP-binding protein [Conexivisphaerales archaeon]